MDIELILTVWDNRKTLRTAAKILRVRSDRVSVHIASRGSQTFRAIFIDGVQQESETTKRALDYIRRAPLELPQRYRAPVETQ
jgi:hypothetical protein